MEAGDVSYKVQPVDAHHLNLYTLFFTNLTTAFNASQLTKNTKELGAKHDELFCSTEYLSLLNLNITKLPSN